MSFVRSPHGAGACTGVEVPLASAFPFAAGREREHFDGMFRRLKNLDFPLDQFWLYTSEGAMVHNHSAPQVQQVVKEAIMANEALKAAGLVRPPRVARAV